MALTLTLREGHDFFIGDQRCVIDSVRTPLDFKVIVDGGGQHRVTDGYWTEVTNAKLQAGIPRKQDGKIVRIMIDAPGLKVLRGDLYRASQMEDAPNTHQTSETSPNTSYEVCAACAGRGYLINQMPCSHCGGHGCDLCGGTGYYNDKFKCPDCGANQGEVKCN